MMAQVNDGFAGRAMAMLTEILAQNGLTPADVQASWQWLAADGSTRRFGRISLKDGTRYVVVGPGQTGSAELAEARAAALIGAHLAGHGAPVPAIYGYDADSGLLCYEDLGDTQLYDLAIATNYNEPDAVDTLRAFYRATLSSLVTMQLRGGLGFTGEWCWDTPSYSRQLMLDRESGYFLRAFWQGLLAKPEPPGLAAEFNLLASKAAEAPAGFFLHRDFQSRNIMIHEGRPRFIDYQGGRLGPLGYDLASLLIDPYVQLPVDLQDEFYHFYLGELTAILPLDPADFARQYLCLALQRNLQILGAFAFLSTARGKVFFADFIGPALQSLAALLARQECLHLPVLTASVAMAREHFAKTI